MKIRLSLLVATLLWAGCDSDVVEDIGARTLYLRLFDTPAQPNDYHYEGWINIDGLDKSFGKFSVDEHGRPVTLDGTLIDAGRFETSFDLDSSLYAFVTIEPPGDADDVPSQTRLMGGLIRDHAAELLVTNYEGLEDGLVLSMGSYILATPTNGPNTDETSGIWFVNLTAGDMGRGLRVPVPLAGWHYEGWVQVEGATLSTGAIPHHSRDDLAAPYSGPNPTFGFPGEDFLHNAPPGVNFPLRLGGAFIIVSLEPDPDPDPGTRSTMELLRGRVPGEPRSDSTYFLELNLDGFPAAELTIPLPVQ